MAMRLQLAGLDGPRMDGLGDGGAHQLNTCSTCLAALPTAQLTPGALPPSQRCSQTIHADGLDSLQAMLQTKLQSKQGLLPHNHLHVALRHVDRGVHKVLVADAEQGWVLAGCAKAVVGGVEDVSPEAPG